VPRTSISPTMIRLCWMKLKVASTRRPVMLLSEIVADMLSPSLWSSRQQNGSTMDGCRRVQSLECLGGTAPEAGTLFVCESLRTERRRMQLTSCDVSVATGGPRSLLINHGFGQPPSANAECCLRALAFARLPERLPLIVSWPASAAVRPVRRVAARKGRIILDLESSLWSRMAGNQMLISRLTDPGRHRPCRRSDLRPRSAVRLAAPAA
jgi:hypothetical protein